MAERKPISVPDSRFTCAASQRNADIHVYGSIGVDWYGDGIDPTAFCKAVDALDVDTINVLVNSPGGDAFGGIAMANALRRHRAHVTVTVDGLAASAASMVAMGGDELVMGRNSMLMIHDASGLCVGNAADMAEAAALLGKLSDSYADAYAEKAGSDRASMRELMRAETWLTPAEAVDAGLADRVDVKASTSATASFDLRSFFASAPISTAPAATTIPPGSSPEDTTTRKESDMSDTLKAALCERLGIKAELDEAGVIAALDEVLSEQADTNPEPKATAVAPEGTVLVDETAFAELQAKAKRADEAEKAATAQRRDQIIADAKTAGKITPTTEDRFRALLDKDEAGTADLIASLQPVVNLTEHGDARESVEADPEAELYARIYAKEA